jgi:hypothetical protein
MLAGLEGAAPQQLLPGPQVQPVSVRLDQVICEHVAHTRRVRAVLGDTSAVSADTGAELIRSLTAVPRTCP